MSWKYSGASSYIPRETASSRDSLQTKFGLGNSKLSSSPAERRSGWSPNTAYSKFQSSFVQSIVNSPVWERTNPLENSAAVQKLKDRYNLTDESVAGKKPEGKDGQNQKTAKFYGRSYTSLYADERPTTNSTLNYSKFRRKIEKSSLEEKESDNGGFASSKFGSNFRNLDPPKTLYIPADSSRFHARKYTNDLSPTISSSASPGEKTSPKREKPETDEIVVTVVTRGTSPTPTASTVYLRSKRTDYGLEKRMTRPRKKPEMVHRETQTDKEEISLSKYSTYCDNNVRSKPWPSYSSSNNSYSSKFSNKTGYVPRDSLSVRGSLSPSECKRSMSREEGEDLPSPESPLKSPTGKPPFVKETDRKFGVRNSPAAGFRVPLKPESPKISDSGKNPNSPTSPLQCKMMSVESPKSPVKVTGVQSPTVTIDRCADLMQAIADASSASESSEEESSSDEDSNDEEKASPALTIKKSITNFLQNIPNSPTQRQTRSNLFQKSRSPSNQKVNFRRIESGEKAWWMESSDKVPDCVTKTKSTRSVHNGQGTEYLGNKSNNLLSPSYGGLNNWHNPSLARDRSKNSCNDESPREERFKMTEDLNNVHKGNGYAKGDQSAHFLKALSPQPVNSFPTENDTHPMKFNLQVDKSFSEGRRYLNDFSRECSVKDVHQQLSNGLSSSAEDKNRLEAGTMAGLVSKMKEELQKPKPDIRKSSSREMSPMVQDPKSEIELYWKELADSVNRPLRLCDLDFTDLNTDDESDILGNLKMNGEIPAPPPMLILPMPATATSPLKPRTEGGVPAPPPSAIIQAPPMRNFKVPPPPSIPQIVKNKKTVKLFWKEVKEEPKFMKPKTSDGGIQIWDELTQVKLDTQKLEHLFESRAKDLMSKKQQDQFKNKEIIVLDPKRSNAINIGMTKLPPPRAIKTAILKMDSTVINKEGIEKVLTMLPTEEEKVRIQEAQSSNPEIPLGSAEQFLLTLASISQLEARLRLWAFKLDFENSEREICEPLMDLKQGMEILRANKTFRGVLSTLLSIGNFLNGYDVKGFQIEYLSKVPEVKDTVHKHSLLHHLCIIVMEKFPDSTDLYSEIGAVTRASKVDFDELSANIRKLEEDCKLSWNYLKMIAKHEGHTTMKVRMSDFLADCAERIIVLGVVHRRILARFNKFAYWLGVPMNRISTTRPNEIFKIVSEFALEYRTTRDRVLQQIKKINREKSRSRGYLCVDSNDFKMNSKEARDDAKLKQLLGKETTYGENMQTWRRHRKDAKSILQETNQNEAEILETLIKTANQKSGLKERRRSRAQGKCCEFVRPV